ncbi:CHAT domain-containing protein [Amycolatopsis sp. NPDC051758]|uniref:CHAT domain-containing protein n=1 Tax=Amycolatopsis sp. NPDC051758 TaxID=3363935 RepID=UPI0037A912E1
MVSRSRTRSGAASAHRCEKPGADMTEARTKPRTMRDALRRQRQVWPTPAKACWLYLKPFTTVVALVGCVLGGVTGAGFLPASGAFLLVVLVRPVRWQWLGIIVAVPVYLVSPLAGIAVLARAAVGSAAIRLAGRTWPRGLLAVRRGRRALFGDLRLYQAERALQRELVTPDLSLELLDRVFETWLAAWATADVHKLLATTRILARGLFLWEWPYSTTGPNVEVRMLRMVFAESVLGVLVRLGAAGVTLAAVELLGLVNPGELFGWTVPAWVALLPPALLTWSVSRRGSTPAVAGPVLSTVVSFLLYGWAALPLLAIAVLFGLMAPRVANPVENRLLGAPVSAPKLPWGIGAPRTREIWKAARRAMNEDRHHVARRLWSNLATDENVSTSSCAAAYAASAYVNMRAGSLQAAVDQARKARSMVTETDPVAGMVYGTAGRVLLAAGDTAKAKELLNLPAVLRYRDPLVATARAQALALEPGKADAALIELTRAAGGLLRGGNMQQLLDSEVAVVSVLDGRADFATLEQRLLELLQFDLDGYDQVDRERKLQIAIAMARIRLLLGRMELRHGKPSTASSYLRQAMNTLVRPEDQFDQAIARILLGAALNVGRADRGLADLTEGVRQLEAMRGQFAAGVHRNQLINRHGDIYSAALDAMTRLHTHDPDAGFLAVELAESLRRGSLAKMLRERNPGLSDQLRAAVEAITVLEERVPAEPTTARLGHYHDQLTQAVSAQFAEAYLPEPVDLDRLRAATGSAHCLIYQLQEFGGTRIRGHVIWSKPDGAPSIHPIDLSDPSLLAALWATGTGERRTVMGSRLTSAEIDRWRTLCAGLLPPALRTLLAGLARPVSLVVVPQGRLAAFPWAALRLDDGRALVEAAVIQLTPSLALMAPELTWPPVSSGAALVSYLDPELATEEEHASLTALGHLAVAGESEMARAMRSGSVGGVYIAAHGDDVGMAQHVVFDGKPAISAGSALTLPWPPWVIFASCLVAQVPVELGMDPLGLPVSCLLGGAQAVVGGIIEVHSVSGGRHCAELVQQMTNGVHPAVALRAAQLAELHRWGKPSPARWAGFACLSRVGVPG